MAFFFYFRTRFLCLKQSIKKIRINSKILCPQSPSFLVPGSKKGFFKHFFFAQGQSSVFQSSSGFVINCHHRIVSFYFMMAAVLNGFDVHQHFEFGASEML